MAVTQAIPAGGARVATSDRSGAANPLAGAAGMPSAGGVPKRAGTSANAERTGANQGGTSPAGGAPGTAASESTSTAMVPVDSEALDQSTEGIDREELSFSPVVARLPVELDVMVPVRDFRVRNLLALEPGQIVESQWVHGDDVPINAGEIALVWSEFEVIDTQLAVRITRLS